MHSTIASVSQEARSVDAGSSGKVEQRRPDISLVSLFSQNGNSVSAISRRALPGQFEVLVTRQGEKKNLVTVIFS